MTETQPLLAVTIIFAVIIILGIWGWFGGTENTGNPRTNQKILNPSR